MEKNHMHISYQSDNLAFPEITVEDEGTRKTLIVIDMQNDFIDGALGTPEAVAIVENVKAKIKEYVDNEDEIIYTMDTHRRDYLDTNEGKHLPVEHCIEGTRGWEIADGLYVEGCPKILKNNFGFMDWKNYNLEDVEIIGLCTDICVVANALIIKTAFPEIPIKVDSKCCAGVTPATHAAALETMKMCQIEVV